MTQVYKLNPAEYRKKLRDEQRLEQLKDIIDKAHRITRQIKKRKSK